MKGRFRFVLVLILLLAPGCQATGIDTSVPTPVAPLNQQDAVSVVTWFTYALKAHDAATLEQLTSDVVAIAGYNNNEVLQIDSREEFLKLLNAQRPSQVACDGIDAPADFSAFVVHTTPWEPPFHYDYDLGGKDEFTVVGFRFDLEPGVGYFLTAMAFDTGGIYRTGSDTTPAYVCP